MNQELKLLSRKKVPVEQLISELRDFSSGKYEDLASALFGSGQLMMSDGYAHLTVGGVMTTVTV